LVSTALMCLMLLLAARIPFVDRTMGHDQALQLHSKMGKWTIYGLLAHGVFLIAGYSVTAQMNPVTMFVDLWQGSTDFIWAIVAFALLAVVGVSSMVAARRRYPYEFWYGVHLTTYLAIAASIPHQFSMSGLFAPGTWERTYWIGFFLATGFALLAFRVFLPIATNLEHGLKVSSVTPAGPDAVSVEVTGRNVSKLGAHAGQWLNWRFMRSETWWHPHPFSLSASPTGRTLRFTVRNLGAGTSKLMALKPGTRVWIEGPYGMFHDAARTTEPLVLVGAGIGIAPIRALLEEAAFVPGHAAVILRASTPDELYLVDEVQTLCRIKGASLTVLVGPREGDSWVPQLHAGKRLRTFVPWIDQADVFICGPNAWMDAVLADACSAGVPEAQIHDERFDW
ncbi:MAG TPA: ferredoxin reductase family protein, partial [Propionibacteriaceae bacterium]|nr:ferredoxin reductase family protein [Propionibacteriaceae bacterium]